MCVYGGGERNIYIYILYIYMHKTLLNFGQSCSSYFWSAMRARGSASVHYKIALHFQLLI